MTLNVSKQTAYVVMLTPVQAVSKQMAYITMFPATETIIGSATIRAEVALSAPGGEIAGEKFARTVLRIEVGLTAEAAEISPKFHCAAPPVKLWTRTTITPKAWTCAVITPATSCEDEDQTPETAEVLEYVSGDVFVTVQGYQLKLIG